MKITPLQEDRYSIAILEGEDLDEVIDEQEEEITAVAEPHIDLLSKLFKIGKCDELKYVFIGKQERSRVENNAAEVSDPLSPYLIEQAEKTGNERIEQIDCIYLKEDDNLIIPIVIL